MIMPGLREWLVPALVGLLFLAVGVPGASQETGEAGGAAKAAGGFGGAPALIEALAERRRANQSGLETQKRIDELSDQTDALFARVTAATSQLEALRGYNQTMREIVFTQDTELGSLREQLEQVDAVGRSVTPLMWRMIAALDSFVQLDVPFLVAERTRRVEDLRKLMARADVPVSEKYRVIMEAYQVETDYGRTIEAYRGPLVGGSGETVDFLRFGRIALVYLALDESEVGVWDARARSWVQLDRSFVSDVRTGLRIARKQIAPDLVTLPLPQPSTNGSEG